MVIGLLVLVSLGAGSLSVRCRGSGGTVKAAGPSIAKKSFAIVKHSISNFHFRQFPTSPKIWTTLDHYLNASDMTLGMTFTFILVLWGYIYIGRHSMFYIKWQNLKDCGCSFVAKSTEPKSRSDKAVGGPKNLWLWYKIIYLLAFVCWVAVS